MSLNKEIPILIKEREKLNTQYKKVVIERNSIMDEYSKKMAAIGEEIRRIDFEVKMLRTPVEMEE